MTRRFTCVLFHRPNRAEGRRLRLISCPRPCAPSPLQLSPVSFERQAEQLLGLGEHEEALAMAALIPAALIPADQVNADALAASWPTWSLPACSDRHPGAPAMQADARRRLEDRIHLAYGQQLFRWGLQGGRHWHSAAGCALPVARRGRQHRHG